MGVLKEKYEKEVVAKLMAELGIRNRMAVSRLVKVVLNMGIGATEKDSLKKCVEDLALISGQRPVITKAKQSISNFKLRKGMSIGVKVTLRGARMYEFLERMIHAALPRIRDFRGLSPNAFDGRGNYTLGVREETIFPEIDPNAASAAQGMDVTIVTSARDNRMALALLKALGMPFAAN
jgi:large subunit ribosomal protein L5